VSVEGKVVAILEGWRDAGREITLVTRTAGVYGEMSAPLSRLLFQICRGTFNADPLMTSQHSAQQDSPVSGCSM